MSLRVDDIIYIETSKHKNVFCTAGRHTASIRRWMSIFKKVIIFSLVAVGHIVDTHIIGEGSAVTLPQNNFCGLGVTQRGKTGLSFETPQLGIRAQVQHPKAYASTDKLRNERIDSRFRYVTRGCAPYVEWLGQIHTMRRRSSTPFSMTRRGRSGKQRQSSASARQGWGRRKCCGINPS